MTKGRPNMYRNDEERKEAVRVQKRESAKRIRDAKRAEMEGDGVVDNVKDFVGNKIAKWKQIITGKITQYSPKIQSIIKKYGEDKIVGITIKRTPVQGVITGALSVFSFGEFGKNQKKNDFDELFHLFMELKMGSGTRIIIEKNERINITVNEKGERKHTETSSVPFDGATSLSLNEILSKTQDRMGNNYFKYSAKDNNCQDFILNVLNANGLGNEDNRNFVKQNTQALFADLPYLRKFSNTLTDIGARANVLVSGGDLDNITMSIDEVPKGKGLGKTIKNIKKKIISTDNITMPPKRMSKKAIREMEEGLMGSGMYAGDGIMAGQGSCDGCPMCGSGMYAGEGIEEISHPILDEINGGSIWGDAGKWFKKAGKSINKAVIQPVAKEFSKKGSIQRKVDKAFSKGGVMEKVGREAFREGVPALTGALSGAVGGFYGGPAGGLALGYAGGKGGEELVKMSGIGHKGVGAFKSTVMRGMPDKFGMGFTAGQGISAGQGASKRQGRFVKGSQEAKDYMASLRAKRMGKN